ncbi:MAG TPA: V-type ATP synthase subunit F [Polyangia bacterium]
MRLFCIADEDTVRGFRLAGIEGRAAASAAAAGAALDEAAGRADIGVVIVTEAVAAALRAAIDALRLTHDRPLIVEIPGPGGPLPGRRSLHQIVQAAVGVSVGAEEA